MCIELPVIGSFYWFPGVILGTMYVGGVLISRNEIQAGDLMSFMVAVQTIQRYISACVFEVFLPTLIK